MAYEIHDEDGELGPGPSISGLRELKVFFATQDAKDFPALSMFLEHGVTHLTKALAKECKILASRSVELNKDVAFSFRALSKNANKAKGIVMLAA